MIRSGIALLAAGMLLAGCASQTALLLPGEPGHPVGALAVLGKRGETVLDQANEQASLSGGGASVRQNVTVKPQYTALMAGLPPPAVSFSLAYAFGMDLPEKTPANLERIEQIRDVIATRPGAEVQVTGHTDSVGSDDDNDALSVRRARKFADDLIALGFPADQISIVGRGEREPADPKDPANDDKNRRVEVIIR